MSKKEKKAAPDAAEGAETKPPKSKKKMIGGGVGAILLFIAGGKVMGTGETKTVIKIVNTTTTLPEGKVVALDAITMNLADGHLLKVGIGFQLKYEAAGAAGGHGEAAPADTTDPTKGYARALDIVIDELGKRSMDELAGEGRAVAKEALVKRLEKTFHGHIEDVYFYQFVMQ